MPDAARCMNHVDRINLMQACQDEWCVKALQLLLLGCIAGLRILHADDLTC